MSDHADRKNVLHEIILRLDEKITVAQEKGYDAAEMAEIFLACGYEADPVELRQHLTQALERKRKAAQSKRATPSRTGKPRVKKTSARSPESAASGQSLAPEPPNERA